LSTKKSHGPKKEKEKGTWTFEFVNFYLFLVHPAMFLPYGLCVHQSYYVPTLEEQVELLKKWVYEDNLIMIGNNLKEGYIFVLSGNYRKSNF